MPGLIPCNAGGSPVAAEKGPKLMKNDQPLVSARDFPLALALLTRLPVHVSRFDRTAQAVWAFPLVGLVIGGVAGLAGLLASFLGLPSPINALISLFVLIFLTGAMHEDGIADTTDGLWGGWDAARRLEIMKDSHIGSYGVLALLFSFASRWVALWLLFDLGQGIGFAAILASAAASRAMMPALMAALPNARAFGLSHSTGRPSTTTAAIGICIALLVSVLLLGWGGLWVIICAGSAAIAIAFLASKKIGGQTGDILGAAQQLSEIAVLFALLTLQ